MPAFATDERAKLIDDVMWEVDVPQDRREEVLEHIQERQVQTGELLSAQELRWVIRGYLAKNAGSAGKKHKCFGCDARVLTPKGYRELQELKPLDVVYSWSEPSKRLVINYVGRIYRFEPQPVKRMVSTPTGRALEVTADHPFYLPNEHRYAAIGEVPSSKHLLAIESTPNKCESRLWTPGELYENDDTQVMTISVLEEPFNFIVEGLLVHNKPIF